MHTSQQLPPKVSVLIPVYNRAALVGECIQSALDQTFTDFEIVVVDNASTDNTWNVCQQYASTDSRIRAFRNETNIGPVRNWQRCVSEARGDLGKILFSDDLMFPRFLEHTVPYLENANVAFVSTAALVGETPENGVPTYSRLHAKKQFPSDRYFDLLIQNDVPYSPGAAIFRMSDIRQNILISIPTNADRDFAGNGAGPDLLLYALTALHYRYVVMLPDADVFFRAHPDSITIRNRNDVANGYRSAIAWFCRNRLGRRYWARYVARNWLLDMKGAREWLSIRQQCVTHEGGGTWNEAGHVLWRALVEPFGFVRRQLGKRIVSARSPAS